MKPIKITKKEQQDFNRQMISFRISAVDRAWVKITAQRKRTTVSDIFRQMIEYWKTLK